jgi:uncharacterized protein YkwD
LTPGARVGPEGVLARGTDPLGLLRVILVIAVAAALAVALGVRGGLPASAGDPGTAGQLFQLTNQDRASNGLGALAFNNNLGSIATSAGGGNCGGTPISDGRSADMINRNYFSHQIPPCGQYVWQVFNLGGFSAAGENIGWNNYPPDQSVGQVNTAFMNSPEHRANILGDYNQMGTGAWAATGPWSGGGGSYNGVIMYTEIFIKGGGGSPPPPPPPPRPPRPRPTAPPSGGGGGTTAPPPPAPVAVPSPSPSLCSLPTNLGEADRNSPAPALAPDGGQPPCPSPQVDQSSPSPSGGAAGATGKEVLGAERETARQGLLESVIDRVLRLFLNV